MRIERFLLTVEECVLLTGISRAVLYKAIASEALPSRLIGQRRRRVLVSDLEKFVGAPVAVARAV
jgi:predicted DNA-binding transcriptional regulator AlpA